jgi:Xaa-Pro aminopeptidase
MRADIVQRYVALMRQQGFDAIIAISPENFAHVAGFMVPSQRLMRWRHAAAVVTASGRAALLAVDMEQSTVRHKAPEAEVRVWAEFAHNAMATLARLLADLGLSAGRIGTEFDYLPAGDLARLAEALPGARFEPAEAFLARLRQLKSPEEIALLRRLSMISDQAITDAFAAVRTDSTEMDIAGAMTRRAYELGANRFDLMIVATGPRSVFPNVGPTDRRLEKKDVCRVEVFTIIDGYHAGVCRTAVVEEAPPHAERIWAHLVECKYMILDMIKPGASTKRIYNAFLAKMKELDLPPISFVGHGIGLHLHEDPYLGHAAAIGGAEDVALEAGMVLGIEPLVYETGYGFGLQNKDMVLVTKTGSELLSSYANTDKLLVVK